MTFQQRVLKLRLWLQTCPKTMRLLGKGPAKKGGKDSFLQALAFPDPLMDFPAGMSVTVPAA